MSSISFGEQNASNSSPQSSHPEGGIDSRMKSHNTNNNSKSISTHDDFRTSTSNNLNIMSEDQHTPSTPQPSGGHLNHLASSVVQSPTQKLPSAKYLESPSRSQHLNANNLDNDSRPTDEKGDDGEEDVCPLDKKSPTPTPGPAHLNSMNPTPIRSHTFSSHEDGGRTMSNTQSPRPLDSSEFDKIKHRTTRNDMPTHTIIPTKEAAIPVKVGARNTSSNNIIAGEKDSDKDSSKISAYARLDFENFTFFVQTLQVVLGRKSNDDLLQSSHHAVDVHLSSKKAISRRHAKIFYNFGTQRFELSILGRNGAFVDDLFVEKGITVPLADGSKIQVGDIPFTFVLPSIDPAVEGHGEGGAMNSTKPINPSDAINLRSNLYNTVKSSPRRKYASDSAAPTSSASPEPVATPPVKEPPAAKKKSIAELEETRKNIQRRKSLSRRKSLAAASIDEINEILRELGPEIDVIDDENEEDSEILDAQIQSILDDYKRRQSVAGDRKNSVAASSNSNGNDDDLALFSRKGDIKDEEDEIDQLVKQHNLSQGVNLDESVFLDDINETKDAQPHNTTENVDLDLTGLDQEIATLAPLIDAHHQDLLRGGNAGNTYNDGKRLSVSGGASARQPASKNAIQPPFTIHQPPPRTTPLMGKPAVPRMGRPASIQPPASRLYGRTIPTNKGTSTSQNALGGLSKAQLVNNRLTPTNAPLAGLPTHLVAQGGINSGLPLKVANGHLVPQNQQATHLHHIPKPGPPKPPQPILEVMPLKLADYAHSGGLATRNDDIVSNITTPLLLSSVKVLKVCQPRSYPSLTIPPKYPRKRKDIAPRKQPSKKVYTLDEIPEQYRVKPTLSYSLMITNVLKAKGGTQGLTATDVAESIKESYPYYKYCADGWQFSINHNLALNRYFKKLNQVDDEWTWGIDEAYVNERERVRMKQQEIASAKAKAAALKAEELKQKQRLEAQQAASQNLTGRPGFSPYSSLSSFNGGLPQSQFISQLQSNQYSTTSPISGASGKPKTIAELASEIRRDGLIGSKAPLYFKPTTAGATNNPNAVGGAAGSETYNIKAQLAANRAASSTSPSPPVNSSGTSTPQPINSDTKKSLAYLQKELFTLYKARKLSYNTATTTEIITKALATTIAQVNVIGAKAGCGNNALSFLVEKAPQQVSKILDIALSKSIKEKQGTLNSRPSSRGGTPAPSNVGSPIKHSPVTASPSTATTPKVPATSLSGVAAEAGSIGSTPVISRTATPTTFGTSNTTAAVPAVASDATKTGLAPNATTGGTGARTVGPPSGLSKPPSFNSKPPTYVKADTLSRPPPQFTSASAMTSGTGTFASSPVLSKPPSFLSNKPPSRPVYQSPKPGEGPRPPAFSGSAAPGTPKPESDASSGMKRELEDNEGGNDKKLIKTE